MLMQRGIVLDSIIFLLRMKLSRRKETTSKASFPTSVHTRATSGIVKILPRFGSTDNCGDAKRKPHPSLNCLDVCLGQNEWDALPNGLMYLRIIKRVAS